MPLLGLGLAVIFLGGLETAVAEQRRCQHYILRRFGRKRGCGGVAEHVRRAMFAEPFPCVPAYAAVETILRHRRAMFRYPKRIACWLLPAACAGQKHWTIEVEVALQVWLKDRRQYRLEPCMGFSLLRRKLDKPLTLPPHDAAADFKRGEVLAPDGDVGKQGDHEPIAILHGIRYAVVPLRGMHEVIAKLRQLIGHQYAAFLAGRFVTRADAACEAIDKRPVPLRREQRRHATQILQPGHDGLRAVTYVSEVVDVRPDPLRTNTFGGCHL